MTTIFQFIQNHIPWLINYRYLFLFLGTAIEGFNTLVLSGFLLSVGAVAFVPLIFLLILGEVINGYAWYFVGYFAGARAVDWWEKRNLKAKRAIEKVKKHFERYSGRTLILTRMTISMTITLLIFTGSLKFNLKKFSLYNAVGATGWVFITVSVGYFFGTSYKLLYQYARNFSYVILFLVAAVFVAYLLKKLYTSAFIRSLELREHLVDLGEKVRDGIDEILSNGDKK